VATLAGTPQKAPRDVRVVRRFCATQYFGIRHPGVRVLNATPSSQAPTIHSQAGQDAFIFAQFYNVLTAADFPKVFVDVGANHPRKFSNSLLFEEQLGFRTIAIDPLARHAESWRRDRGGATFVPVAVGARSGTALLHTTGPGGGDDMYSTLAPNGTAGKVAHLGDRPVSVEVTVRRLQEVLEEHGITGVGILSIDVEGTEREVLEGIDLGRTGVRFMLIENNAKRFGDEKTREYLRARGFSLHTRFWNLDDLYVPTR
jgi:FkbM family methyltransferase